MNNDMPIKAEWNTTGYVQLGDSRLPVERFASKATIEKPAHSPSTWNEAQYTQQEWHSEGVGILTEAGNALFAAWGSALSLAWEHIRSTLSSAWEAILSAFKPRHANSKQTRAFYRVRARDWERRKVVVHTHKRKHRRERRTQ